MNYEFSNSQTYQALMKLNGGNMPMKPADSPFLGFSSYIIKIFTGVGSSKEFAEHRLIEFNAIMELMLKEKQNQMKSIKNNEEEF